MLKNRVNTWLILCLILITCLFVVTSNALRELQEQDITIAAQDKLIASLKQEYYIINEPYTVFTNFEHYAYDDKPEIPADCKRIYHTVDGVRYFDVTIEGTLYRYVPGRVPYKEMTKYAPWIYVE